MCAASMVTDYYRDKWPVSPMYPETPEYDWSKIEIQPLKTTMVQITMEQWLEYLELKRRMEEYDAKTGQPECIKPEVAEWEEVIVRVLKERGILAGGILSADAQ